MTYPATTYAEGVELTITSGNQLHEIINGDATEEINTESGMVPSVRKALADSMLFKPAIAWAEGSVESDPFQTRLYGERIYWAPAASNETPISMGTNPNIDGNWFLAPVTGFDPIVSNTNLLSNHNFIIQSPDDITHPNATPESYAAGTQIFSGVYAGDSGCTITFIDGRVNCTAGDYQFKVANTNGLDRVPVFASSVSDYDGNPITTGVGHALVSDEYVVTVTPAAGEVFSVKLEQGDTATRHEVGVTPVEAVGRMASGLLGGRLFSGGDGNSVDVGDVIPNKTTHLSTLVDGMGKVVSMSPVAYGVVTELHGNSAVVSGNPITLKYIDDYAKPVSITQTGAIGDYSGLPEYDGNDASRITFTDNSEAIKLALQCEPINGTLSIKVPTGHFGYSSEVLPDFHPDVKKVIIKGESKETSILDFVREKSSGDEEYGLTFDGIDVIWADITTKCTTKAGPLNGDKTDAYQGLVNFALYENAAEITFERVLTERANQEGHAIRGASSQHTLVRLIDCVGRYNTITGYNCRTRCKLVVDGGEYYRNGFPGVYSSGYGVAGGSYNDDWEIYGGRFYENYRTGFDNHGGNNLVMIGSYFKNNYARDIAWVNRFYNNSVSSRYLIKDVNIDWNDDGGFIQHAYDELSYIVGDPLEVEYKTKSFLAIGSSDTNQNVSILMDNVNIRTFGTTPEMWRFFAVSTYCKFPTFRNCNFDFTQCKLDAGTPEISRWMHLGNDIVAGSRLSQGVVDNCTFKMPNGELPFDPSCDAIFLVNANSKMRFINSTFEGDNWVLIGGLDNDYSSLDEPVCARELIGCTWITNNMVNRVGNTTNVDNWMDWLSSAWMFADSNVELRFGQDVYKKQINESVVGIRGEAAGATFTVDIPTTLGRVMFEVNSFLSTLDQNLAVYHHNGTTSVIKDSGQMTTSNGAETDLGDGRKVTRFVVTHTGNVGLSVEYTLKSLGAYGLWYKQ